jgi:hypothetical protein
MECEHHLVNHAIVLNDFAELLDVGFELRRPLLAAENTICDCHRFRARKAN